MKRVCLLAVSLVLLASCGGGGGDTDTLDDDSLEPIEHVAPASVTRVDTLAAADFEALAGQQADLGQALQRARGLAGDGAAVTYAGVLEDQAANVVRFGEVSGASGTVTVAWACAAEVCRALVATRTPGAEPTFTDAAGAPAEAPALAAPALLKTLPGKNLDEPTSVVTGALQEGDLPLVDVTRRRFVVASAFGAVFDLDVSGLAAAATASGAYDDVQVLPCVTSADLDALMSELKEGDVLVWVGAGVTMRATSTGSTKTVGMTVNRAVFGDETVHVAKVRELLKGNPFRDLALPSLVVLAGGETWGDGAWDPLTDDDAVSPDALINALQVGPHAVVAVQGSLDALALSDSLGALFERLFAGEALGPAVDAASRRLERMGLGARWLRLPVAPQVDLTLPGKVDDYWATSLLKKAPAFAELYVRVALNYTCLDANSGVPYTPDALEDMVQNLYVREITAFDGPVFTKDWQSDPAKGEDVHVSARLPRLEAGQRFVISVRGDVSNRMRDVQLYGLARVTDVASGTIEGKGTYLEVQFTGNVSASTFLFTNAAGVDETCRLNATDTTTEAMSHNSEPSWIRLFQ